MRKFPALFVLFVVLTYSFEVNAQAIEQDEDLVQVHGRLLNELLQPLPYAHVLILNNYRGTITDREGKYSLVTNIGDSVLFSCLGYKKFILIVPDTLSEAFLNLDPVLPMDTFMIAEVEIYPWKSYEEFKRAFLNVELPDDDLDHARKNIALLKTQIILDDMPSARGNFQQILNDQYRQSFNQGTYPTYQVFNVMAWADFFKALKRGDFSKYEENSD